MVGINDVLELDMISRRNLSLYLTGGAAALLAAGCTPQQVTDVEAKVAALINQIQAAVRDACQAFGKVIPTANTVFAILVSLVGSTNVIVATATMVAQAVADIVAVGCPPAPPTPTGTARKTDKGVPVEFY